MPRRIMHEEDLFHTQCNECMGEGIIQDDEDVINADSYVICDRCNGKRKI